MNVFILDKILKELNDTLIEVGKEYFLTNKVSDLSYFLKNNNYYINSICNQYSCQIQINNNRIIDFSCECSQYKYKIICKHVVASLFKFNEKINLYITKNITNNQINLPSEIVDILKRIIEIEKFFCLEFSNNSVQLVVIDNNLLENIIKNIELLKETFTKNSNDFSLQKLRKIINEIELIKSNGFIEKRFFQGEDIDIAIDMIINNNFEYLEILLNKNKLTDIELLNSAINKLNIRCDFYKTTFEYLLSTNVLLVDFIYSSEFTYLFLNVDNNYILYKIDYEDVKKYKILKSNHITSKNKTYIENKIDLLKSFSIFETKIVDHTKDIDNKRIDLVLEYDVNKKKIILHVKTNFINDEVLNEILIKKFNKYIDEKYNFKQKKFIFDNNQEFDEFINKFKDDDTFHFIFPKYLNDIKHEFNLEFDIKDKHINFNLQNEIINTAYKFKKIKKAFVNNEKFIEIDNNIYVVKNFNLGEIEKQFEKYNISKIEYSNNIIDFKNIFLLSEEINDKKIISYMNKINNEKVSINIKKDILNILKPYQIEGIKWIKKTLKLFNGCILADEMGLGKTIQTLALLDDFYSSNPKNKNVLIITPSILLKNWLLEIKKFNFDLDVIVLDGNRDNRIKLLDVNRNNNKILITTYNQLINDYHHIKNILFEYIILDEGQKIKNFNSETSKKIRSLSSINRIILSGTPIENNLLELWTIFDFILPNFLLPYSHFRRKYKSKFLTQKDIDFLNLQTSPFILKRTKENNLILPSKKIEDIFIEMNKEEKRAYNEMISGIKMQFNNINKKDSLNILSLLTNLRMFCCLNDFGSSKKQKLFSILKEIIPKKQKIIVFCFFSSILEKLSIELSEMGINNLLLIGKTVNRWKIIDEFYNSDCQILLCSLKTGGIGLNLTNANYVINYSPWWNESSENQAIDRVHRIGQSSDVVVNNLLLNNTIEMDIYNLKKQKTILIDNVINDIDYYELLNKILNKGNYE